MSSHILPCLFSGCFLEGCEKESEGTIHMGIRSLFFQGSVVVGGLLCANDEASWIVDVVGRGRREMMKGREQVLLEWGNEDVNERRIEEGRD